MSWETAMTREFPEAIPQARFVAPSGPNFNASLSNWYPPKKRLQPA